MSVRWQKHLPGCALQCFACLCTLQLWLHVLQVPFTQVAGNEEDLSDTESVQVYMK